jgi:ubiquitin-protein ligase
MTPGIGRDSPRLRRLRSDNERMRALVANSDLIRFEEAPGPLAEQYTLIYTCRGVKDIDEYEQPIFSELHHVTIQLPRDYPLERPETHVLSPIFHPNIDNHVCIDWTPAMSLDEYCVTLGQMIQYRIYNPFSPLSSEAASWAQSHARLLPIDTRPLRRGIAETEATGKASIHIRIRS